MAANIHTIRSPLEGARKGEAPPVPRGLIPFSQRQRALRALVEWMKDLDKGHPADISAYAEKHRLSRRDLIRQLQSDEYLRQQVFAPLATEAKLGLRMGVAAGMRALLADDSQFDSPAEAFTCRRLWAEFFAKLDGGGFEARKVNQPVLVLQQLIPDLPPQAKSIQARVLEEPEPESLEEALGS